MRFCKWPALLLLGVLLLLPACDSRGEGEDAVQHLIGVCQANLTDPWQIAMKVEIEEAIDIHAGVKTVYADAGGSVERQKENIRDMLVQQVDILIVHPVGLLDLEELLEDAAGSCAGVVVLSEPYAEHLPYYCIYTSNLQMGRLAGEVAGKLLDGSGTILEVQGDPSTSPSIDRKRGFLEAIDDYPGLVKEYVVVGYGFRDTAYDVLNSSGLLDRLPKVDLVFAHSDEMGAGVAELLREQKIDAPVIGVGGLEGRGTELLAATVHYPTGGLQAVELAMEILAGKKQPASLKLEAEVLCFAQK